MIGALAHSPASDPNPPASTSAVELSDRSRRCPSRRPSTHFLASARILDNPRRSLRTRNRQVGSARRSVSRICNAARVPRPIGLISPCEMDAHPLLQTAAKSRLELSAAFAVETQGRIGLTFKGSDVVDFWAPGGLWSPEPWPQPLGRSPGGSGYAMVTRRSTFHAGGGRSVRADLQAKANPSKHCRSKAESDDLCGLLACATRMLPATASKSPRCLTFDAVLQPRPQWNSHSQVNGKRPQLSCKHA